MRGSHKVQTLAKVFSGHLTHINGFLAGCIYALEFTHVPDNVDKPCLVTPGLPRIPAPAMPALILSGTGVWGLGALCDFWEDLIGSAQI